ncbi:hypothetical protein QYM36_013715 [Artemia franciscana]|uniref:SEC63 domain-containing protein n=1 Tax=Artemia franciscana TaxID=6661 RepID=A0AA88HQP7_ARTSF|nr:hypothetical protein QYM36_013715 [Artemia franciscana]
MYYYCVHKTPSMILKRVVMILGASFEFHVKQHSEIQESPSGNKEIHMVFKILPKLNEKNQERPFCFYYSVKSRTLIHAHLSRLSLSPQTLEKDRMAVIGKCPELIQEMCVCFSQLMMLAHAGQISKMPHLFSLENTMKLFPMIFQALWEHKNPLLQLPHIDEDILKYISSKYHVKTLDKLVRLDEVNIVKGNMPLVNIQINVEVIDDEETNVITAGALVAASVFLSRKPFSSLMNMERISTITSVQLNEPKIMKGEVKEEKEGIKKKTSIWKPKSSNKGGSQIEDDIRNLDAVISQDEDSENEEDAKDDEDWDKFQNPFNKRQKQEFCGDYLADKKTQTILSVLFHVKNLVDKEEILMTFTAPVTPALYKFTLCVLSDSYLGLDKFKDFRLDVKQAPKQPKNHPQYNFSRTKMKRGKRLNLSRLRIQMTLQSLTIQIIRSLKT